MLNKIETQISHTLDPASNSIENKKELRILMLEDSEYDAELIQMYLKQATVKIETKLVTNKKDYIKALELEEFDVILSDHNLPQFSSLEALKIRNKKKFHVPFILVSGAIPEEYAVAILHEGANDYILKDRPQRLITAITESIKKQKAITEKIEAQQELVKTNERLRLVGKATADAIWDWNLVTNKVIWGEGYTTLFGHTIADLPQDVSTWTKHIHPEDLSQIYEGITNMIYNTSETYWVDEYRYLKADGKYAIVIDKGIVLRGDDGTPYRMVGAMQDITKIKELEREISEQKLNHQIRNTEVAIQAQEEEKKSIGKELHDNINQLMAFSKLMLDTARNSPDIKEICIDKSYDGIIMAIEEVRKLSHSLAPPAFNEENKFIDAVNELVYTISLSGNLEIVVNIPTNAQFKLSNEKIKLTFYRIIQEQLSNILKYANATKGSITIKIIKNVCQLIIADNGVGFDSTKNRKGIGLRNMASRVEVHGGKMDIISAPGKGCTLKIEVPF